jgi:predicted flap endonuclease-1-like 5' DNA nuclease
LAKLSDIEGIGETYAAKLKEADVTTIEKLLDIGCEKKGRKEVSKKSGISEKQILNWVNRADLSRVKGISTQYADLLECAGVDTVPELAQRNAENLFKKMEEVNAEKNLVRKPPSLSGVEDWISQAKALPRKVNY